MKTGYICQKYQITRDTLRFYIKKKLLNPKKVGNIYDWSKQDEENLANIMALRDLELPISIIQKIKENHDQYCGSLKQAHENYHMLTKELEKRKRMINNINKEMNALTLILKQLEIEMKNRK